jgi:hypothetical protein
MAATRGCSATDCQHGFVSHQPAPKPTQRDCEQYGATNDFAGVTYPFRGHPPARSNKVAEHDKGGCPDDAAYCIEDEELPIAHSGSSGNKWRQRSHQMREMADESDLAAMTREEPVHTVQVLPTKPKPPPMLYQPSQSQITSESIADAVAENRCGCDYGYENDRIEYPLFRQESCCQHKAFPRHEQADQCLAFQYQDHKDDKIVPRTDETY